MSKEKAKNRMRAVAMQAILYYDKIIYSNGK